MTKQQQENRNLILDDGSDLAFLEKRYIHYLNRTTIIYGRTQSGKSTIIDEIMYIIKDFISVPFIICQSSITITSSPYYGKIPNNCIKTGVTKEWMEEFVEKQKGRAAIFKTANDMAVLRSVFNRVKNQQASIMERRINDVSESHVNNINNNTRFDFAQKRDRLLEILKLKNEELINLYKNTIRRSKAALEDSNGLSTDELCCVNYLDFNPNVLIVFDDCASAFKKWVKESPAIKEMFYNGRHAFITQIIACQDDKEMDSELRKNALVSIFTTNQAATANFERASNSYSKPEKQRANMCIKRIFNDSSNSGRNYKKLIYLQNSDGDPFRYTIADIYDNFRIGGNAIWELDGKIDATKKNLDSSSTFFNMYHSF
jgi:hypothetical protein